MENKCRTGVDKTIGYYNQNAVAFIDSTIKADVSGLYDAFEKFLKPGSRVLDLGSGSGRDSKHFSEMGYEVVALDPSSAMCEQTRIFAHVPVFEMRAEDMQFLNEFDAVWACASLLHVPRNQQEKVLTLIGEALKPEGICYCSWKYGDEERNDNGRHFTDYTEHSLSNLLKSVTIFEVIDYWITEDVRSDRDQKWTNVIIKKI